MTIFADKKSRAAVEGAAQVIFTACASFVILAIAFLTLYVLINGTPAVLRLGPKQIFFGTIWEPTAAEPKYGVFYVILTSVTGTFFATLIGFPVGILTAVFLTELAGKRLAGIVGPAVEILAGIPSVIYGLLGVKLLTPMVYRLERRLFEGSATHRFTGGSNLLSAVLVLAVMILPTVVHVSQTAIRAVQPSIREASLALGASRVQTTFRVVLPAARSGIVTAVVLGVGRAVGEAMAITLVSGGSVNLPLPFHSVRFLTTAIVSEMGYAQGIHRQVLFTIGLVLFAFILLVNLTLNRILKGGAESRKGGTEMPKGGMETRKGGLEPDA